MYARLWMRPLLVMLTCLIGSAAAAADEAPTLDAFFGTYAGESMYPADEYGRRSLHVEIGPLLEDRGFTVEWTTAMEKVRDDRQATTDRLTFVPTAENPNVFRAPAPDGSELAVDPMTSDRYAWAALNGNILSVHVLTIEPNGDYVMQTYDRALTDRGLTLSFVRVRNGDLEKRIWGALERVQE